MYAFRHKHPEMNSDHESSAAWESWPPDVVNSEVTAFAERAIALTGISERDLELNLGAPGEKTAGTRWESADRRAILQADRDLRYYDLLPHVVVSFAILNGRVARVLYVPKWRRCPAEFATKLLGSVFVPDEATPN